jgi:hypothetical protein
MSNKSVLSNMKKEKLMKLIFKIPKNKQLIQELEATFQQIETLQNEVKVAEELYKQLIQELSQEAMPQQLITTSLIEEQIIAEQQEDDIEVEIPKKKVVKKTNKKISKKPSKLIIGNDDDDDEEQQTL